MFWTLEMNKFYKLSKKCKKQKDMGEKNRREKTDKK